MSQLERIYKIDRLLRGRRAPSREDLLGELEVSPATLKRDLEYMRSRLHAPIVWNRDAGGYRYDQTEPGAPEYALPGLWFSSEEVRALLLLESILEQLHSGLLREELQPFEKRLRELIGQSQSLAGEWQRRFRILHAGIRPVAPRHFRAVSSATLARKRLALDYYARARNREEGRAVSPQRLVYYRSNWYLQAWCHSRDGLRTFALDSIKSVRILEDEALEVPMEELDAHLGAGYGIFAGPARNVAVLRFTPEAARWVSQEQWHPKQVQTPGPDGSLSLNVPYSHEREILMDILRHGPDVEVLAPESLRAKVKNLLRETSARYELPKRPPVREIAVKTRRAALS